MLDFLQSRISAKKFVSYKHTIKVSVSCFQWCPPRWYQCLTHHTWQSFEFLKFHKQRTRQGLGLVQGFATKTRVCCWEEWKRNIHTKYGIIDLPSKQNNDWKQKADRKNESNVHTWFRREWIKTLPANFTLYTTLFLSKLNSSFLKENAPPTSPN